jgi:hypothetical protein
MSPTFADSRPRRRVQLKATSVGKQATTPQDLGAVAGAPDRLGSIPPVHTAIGELAAPKEHTPPLGGLRPGAVIFPSRRRAPAIAAGHCLR